MNKEYAKKNIRDIEDIFKIVNKNHFIIDGTLLGFAREKDFIDHDTDIDYGVYANEWGHSDICEFLYLAMKKGFNFWTSYGYLDKYFEFAVKRHGIKIDFFFYRETKKHYVFHAFRNGGANLPEDVITYSYEKRLIKHTKKDKFLGIDIYTPVNVEEVLKAKYGDWREVKKRWSWADNPLNKVNIKYE